MELEFVVEDSSPSKLDMSKCVHFMPCGIAHNGPADVSHYFVTTVRGNPPTTEGSESVEKCISKTTDGIKQTVHLTSSFRGRPLNGCEMQVPTGYKGAVIEEFDSANAYCPAVAQSLRPAEAAAKEANCKWKVVGDFRTLTYWNWDRAANDKDSVQALFQWIRIANDMRNSARNDMESVDCSGDSDTES
ncbi:uncharacterized protein LOC129586319 [Paramacrobiotus metropolitanus]|uniref:uncharacterized protein LOC129586319 n=1 Tax=Paramacrobiotus metropolitanus TaxID=2943436 RepID=UPI0024457CE5|nr:uncharacterized protein LOC129586319 [Paramacrobiotus metropolitanus]